MMDRPPTPYPGAQEPRPYDQTQQSEMIYEYPEQLAAQPGAQPEVEDPYGYPHPAGFPQPDYPPTQQLYTSGYAGNYPTMQPQQYAQTRRPLLALLKKGGNTLWIALTSLVLLLLLVGSGLYYYFLVRSTPEKTLRTYCTAIKNQDGQTLYNTYTKAAQSQTDEAHLQQGLRLIEFLSGGIEDCSIDSGSIHENDPQATARVTFTLYNGRITGTILHLFDEDGQWKIENNTILP